MATEDLIQDPNYTTPGGAPLAALARNPHQNVDLVHGVMGGGTPESTIVLQLADYVPEHTIDGSTIVPSTCTSFVRKIVDGIVSDFESDGVTPYIVSGTIIAHCPDLSGCDCSSELTDVKQELVDIKALVQQLLNGQAPPPTQTQVDTGQPSLRLPAGTYTKAQILARLNAEGYNGLVNTDGGIVGYYGLNEITFAPSSTFDLSIASATSMSFDYPHSMAAGGNEYLLQEVDDFTITVPAGQTVDVHLIVWLTGIAA